MLEAIFMTGLRLIDIVNGLNAITLPAILYSFLYPVVVYGQAVCFCRVNKPSHRISWNADFPPSLLVFWILHDFPYALQLDYHNSTFVSSCSIATLQNCLEARCPNAMDNTTGSFASFGSDFDPEHEALASTRHGENSPRLPNMNGSARRNNKFEHEAGNEMDEEPDYAINTSSIERAFPEFSQAGSSSEDDHDIDVADELSMEVGRGVAAKPTRHMDDSRNSLMSIENSVRSSSPAVRLDYPTSNTPQKSALRNPQRRVASESLRKDAQVRRASQAQKENVEPKASRKDSQRRSFSDMHARVRDSYDGSFIGDERPSAPVNARSTRFNNPNLSNQIAEAVERASQEARRGGKLPNGSRQATANDTMTHQSFLLPDLPNLSELVSGVYEDGTPVYSRQNKMRSTRFVSPPNDGGDASISRQHIPLDAVPVPEDEKALFVSLRVLQERVSELEHDKSEKERKIQDMRQENAFLKADRSRSKDKYGRTRGYESEDGARLANENQSEFIHTSFLFANLLTFMYRIGSSQCRFAEPIRYYRSKSPDLRGYIEQAHSGA